MNEFQDRATDFVRTNYPSAKAAFLGGSTASGSATHTSDLDILVMLPGEWEQVAFVETTRHQGQLVEAFVYGTSGLHQWREKGRSASRPVLDRLIAEGIVLIQSDLAEMLVKESSEALAAGPSAPDPDQLLARRYSLSALIDDVTETVSPGEQIVVMATAWREASELALMSQNRWLGTGKWLLRELRRSGDDFGLAAWIDEGGSDPTTLTTRCQKVLDSVGGYLQEGALRGTKPSALHTRPLHAG